MPQKVQRKAVLSSGPDPDPLVRDTDPDLYQNVTDPQHWSRIRKRLIPDPHLAQEVPGTYLCLTLSKMMPRKGQIWIRAVPSILLKRYPVPTCA
jgi:hypothetical protein